MKSSPVIPVFTLLLMLASESPAEILVRDDLQNIVQLEAPAGRIISLAPHLTELLFSLEVGEQIVGTSRYSDYPPAASQIQVIGDAFSVNVETVVNLKPDVIFAWSTGGANRAIESLRKLGYAIYLNEAKTFQGIGKTLVAMSKLVGKERQGLELEGQFQNRIEGIREANAGFPSPRAFPRPREPLRGLLQRPERPRVPAASSCRLSGHEYRSWRRLLRKCQGHRRPA